MSNLHEVMADASQRAKIEPQTVWLDMLPKSGEPKYFAVPVSEVPHHYDTGRFVCLGRYVDTDQWMNQE